MTTRTSEVTREKLLTQAREAEQREIDLVNRLNAIPGRIAEARELARQRFNVATMELQNGRSTHVPTLDYSEAEAIAESEDDLKVKAKAAGLRKLRLYAAVHRHDEQVHRETYEKLAAPLAELEEQHARITNDLKALQNARATVDKRSRESWSQALQYERAATFHEQQDHPIRRMG